MNTITVNKAILDFPKLVNDTITNFEETIIVGENGSVVLISQKEWESIKETIRLFKDKKSLKSLFDGQKVRKKGFTTKGKTCKPGIR